MAQSLSVVYLIYRRPEHAEQSLAAIRKARPEKLFVAADGPKDESQVEAVEKTRELVREGIDWPCEVYWDLAESNLGLQKRVTSGISWAFEHVDQLIIIEEDCVADPTFFTYAQQLLDRYENDERVYGITGNNFQGGKHRGFASYYFSMILHCWGWATWKDRWAHYDPEMKEWNEARRWLRKNVPEPILKHWRAAQRSVEQGWVDTWDFQWLFSIWANHGLVATPNVNLVTNVGIGAGATNTTGDEESLCIEAKSMRFPLRHPFRVKRHEKADLHVHATSFGVDL